MALAAGLAPALACVACNVGFGAVLTVLVVASAATVLMTWALRRRVERSYDEPLAELIELTREMRQESAGRLVPERGAPAVCILTRMLNEAWASVEERSRLSHANLQSVEMQFDRIHSVLQSLIEGVIVIDMLGEVLLANPAARQLLRGGGRPIEGRPLLSLLAGDLKKNLATTLEQMAQQQRGRAEILGLHLEAKVFDVSIVRVRADRPENDFGSVIVLADVTRNHEIARLKDEFLSSVSHELRTPLTNICAFSEILSQVTPADTDHWNEFLTIISNETRRLKKLVDDVLDFSSLEAGRMKFEPETVDLCAAARVVCEHLAGQVAAKLLTLELVVPEAGVPAWLDREKLSQVLARLLDNAVKFTPERGKIRFAIQSLGEQAEIAVDDSGKGIPIEQRETVFDKFSQLGNLLTDKPTGQGLSLAICRRVLGAQGGMIWCEDSDLGGTRFRILVPTHATRGAVAAGEEVANQVGAG